jgi:cysteine synthase A
MIPRLDESRAGVRRGILRCIGDTPIVPLTRIVPRSGATVLVKLESHNPTGSMKDRMALAMIDAAEADGRLPPGGSVVEYTTGSTGGALALVCGIRQHPLHIVTSDAFAQEKRDHMAILGARLHLVPSDGGRMTEKLTLDMVEKARQLAQETGAYWTDQLRNVDQLKAYEQLGEEIWTQCRGAVDAFVQSVGSGGCIRGAATGLRRHTRAVKVFAVEPAESPVLSGGQKGAHRIDGMGAGFVVPLWRPDIADGIERVSTAEAMEMAFRLARDEGLFGGISTGANVTAALRVAEQLAPGSTVVTLMCDGGIKYLKRYGESL